MTAHTRHENLDPAITITADDARRLTDRIKVAVEATWQLVIEAYESRAWSVLGYSTWDDYCTREFGSSRLRLPREERSDVVQSLRDAGLSIRAIAAATRTARNTVRSELRQVGQLDPPVPNGTLAPRPGSLTDLGVDVGLEPDLVELAKGFDAIGARIEATRTQVPQKVVTGIDGKTYSATTTAAPKRKRRPLSEALRAGGLELRRSIERLERLSNDDRFNKALAADLLSGDLEYTVEACQHLLDKFATTARNGNGAETGPITTTTTTHPGKRGRRDINST